MDVPGDAASSPQLPDPSFAPPPRDIVQVSPVEAAAASATSPSTAEATGADSGTATDVGAVPGTEASVFLAPPTAKSGASGGAEPPLAVVASGGASSSSAAPAASRADVTVYQINVKCIDSTTHQFEVPSDLSGVDLKELIAERLEAPVERQRLIFRGRVVKDDDTVGTHITDNGQTLHMVQRPPPADSGQADAAGGSGASQGASQGASDAGGNMQMHGAPHVHFQFTTNDANGMPQVDFSQLLSQAGLGALGRGGGISMVQSTTGGATGQRGMQPQAQGAQSGGSSSAPASGSSATAGPPMQGSGAAGESQNPLEQLHQQIFGGLMQAQANGQPMTPGATAMGTDGGGMTAMGPGLINMPPGFVVPQMPTGVAGQAAPGQPQNMPMQIVFQQGMGNLAQMLPMMLGETFQMADQVTVHGAMGGDGFQGGQGPQSGQEGQPGAGQQQDSLGSGDTLPWRDLRRLHQHLSRLLGRSSRSRTIPPTHMPGGELNAFLSMLLAAISQLGVAVSDLQASFLDDEGPQPRYRLQLAMALIAAARALRGMATALQSGQLRGGDEPTPAPAPQQQAPQTTQAETEAAAMTSPLVYSSESEAAVETGAEIEGAVPLLAGASPEQEMVEVFLDPTQEVLAGIASAGGQTVITGSGGDVADNDLQRAAEMVQQLFGQLTSQPPVDATPSVVSEGSAAPAPSTEMEQFVQDRQPAAEPPTAEQSATSAQDLPAGLASMPPQVAACWQRWTQAENFRPVLAQAVQAPFSNAYSSGDTVSSRRSPTELPEPEEFLPVRWERTAARVEDLDDLPEPPEHLSRAYLCAFLRDLGRFADSNTTFSSMPEERFPHLTRYARFFAQDQSGAGADSSGGGRDEPSASGDGKPSTAPE